MYCTGGRRKQAANQIPSRLTLVGVSLLVRLRRPVVLQPKVLVEQGEGGRLWGDPPPLLPLVQLLGEFSVNALKWKKSITSYFYCADVLGVAQK